MRLHRCWWQMDVGDFKLVTIFGCWWQFSGVGDSITILVTSFGCWCPTIMLIDRGCWWQNRPKPSPTSQSCRQHISSPTSVANIDVAGLCASLHNITRLYQELRYSSFGCFDCLFIRTFACISTFLCLKFIHLWTNSYNQLSFLQ